MKRWAMVNSVRQAEELKKTGEVWVGSLFLSLSRSKKKEGGRGGASKNQAELNA